MMKIALPVLSLVAALFVSGRPDFALASQSILHPPQEDEGTIRSILDGRGISDPNAPISTARMPLNIALNINEDQLAAIVGRPRPRRISTQLHISALDAACIAGDEQSLIIILGQWTQDGRSGHISENSELTIEVGPSRKFLFHSLTPLEFCLQWDSVNHHPSATRNLRAQYKDKQADRLQAAQLAQILLEAGAKAGLIPNHPFPVRLRASWNPYNPVAIRSWEMDPTYPYYGVTPLVLAAQKGSFRTMNRLLGREDFRKQAVVDSRYVDPETGISFFVRPSHVCAIEGNTFALKKLFQYGYGRGQFQRTLSGLKERDDEIQSLLGDYTIEGTLLDVMPRPKTPLHSTERFGAISTRHELAWAIAKGNSLLFHFLAPRYREMEMDPSPGLRQGRRLLTRKIQDQITEWSDDVLQRNTAELGGLPAEFFEGPMQNLLPHPVSYAQRWKAAGLSLIYYSASPLLIGLPKPSFLEPEFPKHTHEAARAIVNWIRSSELRQGIPVSRASLWLATKLLTLFAKLEKDHGESMPRADAVFYENFLKFFDFNFEDEVLVGFPSFEAVPQRLVSEIEGKLVNYLKLPRHIPAFSPWRPGMLQQEQLELREYRRTFIKWERELKMWEEPKPGASDGCRLISMRERITKARISAVDEYLAFKKDPRAPLLLEALYPENRTDFVADRRHSLSFPEADDDLNFPEMRKLKDLLGVLEEVSSYMRATHVGFR